MRNTDQTGLIPAGRSVDGRYLYRSLSVMHQRNYVMLTHDQRVGLAILNAIAQKIRPGTRVYPMTRQSNYKGYGTRCGYNIWITRPLLSGKDPERSMNVFTHELGHNTQPEGSKPHGPEFEVARCRMVALVKKETHGYTKWPKLDMRKLRDSVAPNLRKAAAQRKRVAAKHEASPIDRWTGKLASAEKHLAEWEAKSLAAERKVEVWRRKVAHAASWLRRSK